MLRIAGGLPKSPAHNTPYKSIRHIGLKLQRQAKKHHDRSGFAENPDHSVRLKMACGVTIIRLRDVPVGSTSLGPILEKTRGLAHPKLCLRRFTKGYPGSPALQW